MADSKDDPEKTRLIRRPTRPSQAEPPAKIESEPVAPEESEMTRLIGPPRRSRPTSPTPTVESPGDTLQDPVVGWLVIISGPGKGNFRRLGYGQNSIGREQSERACLDFGDENISRKGHCFVIYDPRERQFTLRPGDGANLTYLNGKLLSESHQIRSGDKIEIGQTTLRFVPLCGQDFDWHDQDATVRRKNR